MTSSDARSPHCPCFPSPWDDPEDQIDDLFWLEAINIDDLALIAYYLRHSPVLHKPVLSALADKLDPQTKKTTGRYLWKRAHGRPQRDAKSSSDAIQSELDAGNLTFVAAQVRNPNLDRRILSWLADQLDPASPRDARLISRRLRGRPRRPTLRCSADTHLMLLGSKIERKRREFGKLEAALQYFMTKSAEVPNPVSRSKARRAYDYYHARRVTIKNPMV
jgi:hypothetical protein